MLYARSNRLVRLFHSCNKDVLLELGRSFCGSFSVVTCGHTAQNHRFLKSVWHTTYTEKLYMFLVAAVTVQCLCRITFLILSV